MPAVSPCGRRTVAYPERLQPVAGARPGDPVRSPIPSPSTSMASDWLSANSAGCRWGTGGMGRDGARAPAARRGRRAGRLPVARGPAHRRCHPNRRTRRSCPCGRLQGLIVAWTDASDVLSTLMAVAGDTAGMSVTDESGMALATDFRFATRAVEMALELTTRGRVLPSLERTAGGWRARWRPLIDAADRGRIEGLTWSLPAAFLAAGTLAGATIHPRRTGAGGTWRRAPLPLWGFTDALARRFAPTARRPIADGDPGPGARSTRGWPPWPRPTRPWMPMTTSWPCSPARLDAWQATSTTIAEPVRTCFRIIPPVGNDEDLPPRDGGRRRAERPPPSEGPAERIDEWRIEFALQAVDDPSLLVSAATVWADGPELTALERHVAHPDEQLLRGLGRAARLVPSLGPALSDMAPSGQTTDATGILAFLRDGAPILEEAGFGVLAPPWWRSSKARLGLRLRARTGPKIAASTGTIGLDGALRRPVGGGARGRQTRTHRAPSTGSAQATPRPAAWPVGRVARRGSRCRHHRSRKEGATAEQMPAGQVLRTALGLEGATGDLPVIAVEADGWLGDFLAGADDRQLRSIPTPDGFAGELRPYQERGSAGSTFLGDLGLGACLADDMGLGKTAQLLALLVDERSRGVEAPTRRGAAARSKRRSPVPPLGPTLVLCPMSLVGNWQREAARFAPKLSVYVHHGSDRLDGKAFVRHAAGRTWCCPPTGWPPVTNHCWQRCRGVGWSSTRRSRSRTVRPAPPRVSAPSRLGGGSP